MSQYAIKLSHGSVAEQNVCTALSGDLIFLLFPECLAHQFFYSPAFSYIFGGNGDLKDRLI
jgi:hypothetical protein